MEERTITMFAFTKSYAMDVWRIGYMVAPDWAIGIGGFARKRLETALSGMAAPPAIGQVLHPSPASPAANRGWAQAADRALEELGVFA
jgi:single-strand selective monofunctional uracil DNA glycosylase